MADFFAPLSQALSQGDIVAGVPWGLIDDPLTICRPVDRSKSEGKAQYGPASALKGAFKGIEAVHARAQLGLGMVLWHDCQIDKFKNQERPPEKWFAAIAPILPLKDFDAESAGVVKEGRRRAFFFVPAFPDIGITEDSYVDLRHIWSLKQSLLIDRMGTLSPSARMDLYAHLFTFLTQRAYGRDVQCAHCGQRTPWENVVDVGED